MCSVKIGSIGKFDLNPRGELWRKDENRFGHKLLSKFGWSQGKGLGKNEDGIAENLKVRLKIGNTGVGWDKKLPIGLDYQEYDAVLEDLSKRYQKSGEIKEESISLEKRSQQFKNRIHYQKFVRGKDISRYSEKDMSCIFLSKEPEKKTESTPKESALTNLENHPTDTAAKESVPTFNSQLSIEDYFALKMKNKLGSSLNTSKSEEEVPQSKTDATNRKRKHELKSIKKAKRIKHELEIYSTMENVSDVEKNTLEFSSSLKETPEENLDSNERIQNIEESYNSENMKRKKKPNKKMKNPCDNYKAEPEIENYWQEEKNVMKEYLTENKNLDFVWSQEENPNSVKECKNIADEVKGKQRKKEKQSSMKTKDYCLEETEFFTGTDKVLSLSESDDVEKNCSEKCTLKTVKGKKVSRKENKKHKNKAPRLKSCLKSCLSNNKYSFKPKRNVSFCEDISYRMIENFMNNVDSDIVLETNEQLLSCSDEESTDSEIINETKNIETGSLPLCTSPEYSDADNTVPECFKLPKLSSANYDSWLETQRMAARMKVYKNMVKKIKKHPILRKTNLLDIKGYANWGL